LNPNAGGIGRNTSLILSVKSLFSVKQFHAANHRILSAPGAERQVLLRRLYPVVPSVGAMRPQTPHRSLRQAFGGELGRALPAASAELKIYEEKT
jgi:hypothetical protein